ncbi:hypothetical protein [Paenibacillus sp. EZ-K15]|uniref:hypothetical protein n=1 Tax=Paenibacillus sp. EZ-K15 TaxID=2044275 RepID=UPI00192A53F3|nr:hypothetical protein [Paenibacillus sp. EZ-K15]
MEADPGVYPLYHDDFRLLNGKLLEHYGCTEEMRRAIGISPEIIDLQEVKTKEVIEFVPHVFGDMNYEKQVLDEPLNVFSFIQIEGYIETSVNIGVMILQHI